MRDRKEQLERTQICKDEIFKMIKKRKVAPRKRLNEITSRKSIQAE
jgi:hypothetical protein